MDSLVASMVHRFCVGVRFLLAKQEEVIDNSYSACKDPKFVINFYWEMFDKHVWQFLSLVGHWVFILFLINELCWLNVKLIGDANNSRNL